VLIATPDARGHGFFLAPVLALASGAYHNRPAIAGSGNLHEFGEQIDPRWVLPVAIQSGDQACLAGIDD